MDRLLAVHQTNWMRPLALLLDSEDVWEMGTHATFKGDAHDRVLVPLRSQVCAHRRPRVWNKVHDDIVSGA